MKVIEKKLTAAIQTRKTVNLGNTLVTATDSGFVVTLHGNEIARLTGSFLRLSSCGWRTSTTKSRLNAILHAVGFSGGVSQKSFSWSLWQNTNAMAGRSVCPSMPFDDGMEIVLPSCV